MAMRQLLKHIPNTITSLNLASGTLAVFMAVDGHLTTAGILICLAALFDFLDGVAARLLKAYSEIGKELDSLADMISFGLAPTAILFTLLEMSLFGGNQPVWNITASWYQWLILLSALIMPVFSALRLARFNVHQSGVDYFLGLPTPSNALIWVSLGFLFENGQLQGFLGTIFSPPVLVLLAFTTSAMLVINLPMFSLKFKSLLFSDNWYRYMFIFMSLIFLAVFHVNGLSLIMLTYILLNIIFYLLKVKI